MDELFAKINSYVSMAHVINPYVQPYTAKPWGYAGSPGHPYVDEWWTAVEGTAWAGWQNNEDRHSACENAKQKMLDEGRAQFLKIVDSRVSQ